MKKSTLRSLVSYLQGATITNLDEIRDELVAELAKDEAKAQANRDMYAAARKVVLAHMTQTPQTSAEIMTACEGELPEGFTKSKLQYAFKNYWTDDIVTIPSTKTAPNQYRRA